MSDNHDVLRFHQHLGLPVRDEPTVLPYKEMMDRVKFMEEELAEMKASIATLYSPHFRDSCSDASITTHLAGIFDALIDLVYVAHGTAIQMGLPWQQGWDRVQDANMQKQRQEDDGSGHKIGVVKPEGWKAPDITTCLADLIHIIDGFRNTYGDRPLRCEHGLHVIIDVCPHCEVTAIMGVKPSVRGSVKPDQYYIKAARAFQIPPEEVTIGQHDFIRMAESLQPRASDAELREQFGILQRAKS